VPPLQLLVLTVDRVGDGVGDAAALDVLRHRVNVLGPGLQRVVILASDPVDQDVHLAVVFGEPAGQLLAHQHVLVPVRNAKDAFDRVVVRDGDEVHPPALGLGVDLGGVAVALGALDRVERRLGGAVARVAVAVQVDPLSRGGTFH
jgi:hypothetical protein